MKTGYSIREGSVMLVERQAARHLRTLAAIEFAHAVDRPDIVASLLAGVDYADVRLVADELECIARDEQLPLAVAS